MKVSSLIQHDVVTCSDRDPLARVAQLMWERDLGCIPVIDEDKHVIGMVTDRDVAIAAWLQGRALYAIAVSSVMSKEVVTCTEGDDVRTVEGSMRGRQIRRVPVVDDAGRLVGIFSLNDLARAAVAGLFPATEVAATLAAVSRPRMMPAAA